MSIPRLIHLDDSIIVLDKPPGMPSASLAEGEEGTLAAWIIARNPEQAHLPRGRLEAGLVHRLDNDTSGAIVAARTSAAHEALRAQFEGGAVEKRYLALVVGWPPDKGSMADPIAHHPRKRKRMVVCPQAGEALQLKARPARTEFKALRRCSLEGAGGMEARYALLEVTIRTGVRHQVRAHLASLGFPVAGDRLYQGAKARAADPLQPARHMLHASRIAFAHPDGGARVEFTAPLPEDFREAISKLSSAQD